MGLIDLKRPAHDLRGETAKLAARMENRVKQARFQCEPRGLVEVKRFGAIQTYLRAPRGATVMERVGRP